MQASSTAVVVAPRAPGLRRLCFFALAATIEILLVTLVFHVRPTHTENPIVYANAVTKVAISAFFLLILVAWPQRARIIKVYRAAAAQSAFRPYLAANLLLFISLLAVRIAILQTPDAPFSLLLACAGLQLATGASLAFLAAPPSFWLRLLKLVPVEIMVALAGGSIANVLGQAAQDGWSAMAGATLTVSHAILSIYETNVVLDTERALLGAGDFSVLISAPCSGYEGIALVLTVVPIYLWAFRQELRFPNVLLLLPLGVAAIWLLNALRIAILVSIGAHVSPEIALQGFHSQAGWISFLFVTLGIVAVTRRVPFFAAARPAPANTVATEAYTDHTLAFLAPFMAMVAANILASAFAPYDHALYPVKVFAIAAVLWWFRDVLRPLIARVSWISIAVGLGVGAAWIATDPGRETPLAAWIAALPAGAAMVWLAVRAFGSVVLVPIAEELAFRGFLARWLISTRFESVTFGQFGMLAFAGSSLTFGLLHQRWLAATLAGAVYALLMYRTKRLSDPIAAHAVTNLAIVIWAVAAQQWSLL